MKTELEILDSAYVRIARKLHLPLSGGDADKVQIVLLYSLLSSAFGQDEGLMRHWLNTPNTHLGYVPAVHLADDKLREVIDYLDDYVNR
jgi:hypothetical protein